MEQSWKQPPIIYNRYKMLIVSVEETISNLGWGFPLAVFTPCTKPSLFRMTVWNEAFLLYERKKHAFRCFYRRREEWIVRR